MKTNLISASTKRKRADVFILGSFEKAGLKEARALEPAFAAAAKAAMDRGRFEGRAGQTFSSYHAQYQEAPEVVLLGLGSKKDFGPLNLRKALGQAAKFGKGQKAKRSRIFLDSFTGGSVKLSDAAAIAGESAVLTSYTFDKYKKDTKKNQEATLEILTASRQGEAGLRKRMNEARVIAQGTIFTRNLVNEPGNIMNAQRLAQEARKMAASRKITCKIMGEAELRRLKMEGILAVNRGSNTPPALIILEYGQRYKRKGTICLVGKGVTFDTGGISIKPSRDMEKMKYDMGGASAVLGAMQAVADLKLPLHLVALAPAVENMVAKDPQRPGDIIIMHNGKSVEVLNTDAEGRLILADALSYCEKYKPKAILDLATLTGMAVYTFGDKCCAVLGNNERVISRLKKAGEASGERCWELPMYPEYSDQLKGHHSDLLNIGGTYAGTITAAKFLEEFVPAKTPWAHLDIASMAWCDSPRYDCPKGATGFGVRLLVEALAHWK